MRLISLKGSDKIKGYNKNRVTIKIKILLAVRYYQLQLFYPEKIKKNKWG